MTGRPAEQPKKPKLDLWFQRVFDDEALSHFGTGWQSGTASVFLGAIALGAVGVLWFPEWFSQPLALQLIEVVIVADLAQYAVHRGFHRVPLLWRFHAVHHSSVALDWLAGSRLHLFDAVATRSLVLVPLFLLGFSQRALAGYLVFVSFHAVFIHANVRFGFGPIEGLIVTPRFHHWHHAAADAARDKNFAVHLPWLDRLLGSLYLPKQQGWPDRYGIAGDPVPQGYGGQLAYPFRVRGSQP